MATKTFYSVSEVTQYIKSMMDTDILLSNINIQGELSNVKYHYSGHIYFTLKDEQAVIKGVMFKSKANQLPFTMENGMKVILRGYVSVYEPSGQYQVYVDSMKKQGTGDLYEAFEKLKVKLAAEGLFDASKKKQLPLLPRTVAVVTSATGSVIRDILHVLSRRFPNFHLVLYPVRVQGKEASGEIVRAIQTINRCIPADVIILARGGGSIEELWPFNEEVTARGIFESRIPVISAIGHETDFTIADFVADLRAPTPSAAAELVMPDKESLIQTVTDRQERLLNAVKNKLGRTREMLSSLSEKRLKMPLTHRLDQFRLKCDHMTGMMANHMTSVIRENRNLIKEMSVKLDAMNPVNTMNRGFAVVVHTKNGNLIKSIEDTEKNERLKIYLTDGTLESIVLEKENLPMDKLFKEVRKSE